TSVPCWEHLWRQKPRSSSFFGIKDLSQGSWRVSTRHAGVPAPRRRPTWPHMAHAVSSSIRKSPVTSGGLSLALQEEPSTSSWRSMLVSLAESRRPERGAQIECQNRHKTERVDVL